MSNRLAVIIYCVLIALSAWPIGGNFPHARTVMLAASIILLAIALFSRPFQKTRNPAIWGVLLLGLAYLVFQLMPGTGWLRPNLDEFAQVQQRWQNLTDTLSLYPAGGTAGLCDVLLGVGLFCSASLLFYRRGTILAVMCTAALTGVAIGFFGIIQKLAWDGRIFWNYELLNGGWAFGPFVNKNNAGGFLLACLSGAIFLLAYQIFGTKPGSSLRSQVDFEESNSRNFGRGLVGFIAALETRHLYTVASLAFIIAAIFSSLSRSAVMGTIVAIAVIAVLLRKKLGWLTVAFVAAAFFSVALTIWAEQSDMVTAQLDTLNDPAAAAAPRLDHWSNATPYISQYYIFGSGMGTYDRMYAQFQQGGTFNKWFRHAENVYLETLAEMGLIGITLLLTAIVLMIFYCIRLLRRDSSLDRSLGIAGLFCLVGQSIVGFFDFGIYQPANMTVVAGILGCVTARVFTDPSSLPGQRSTAARKTLGVILTFAVLIFATGWAIVQSHGIESLKHGARLVALYNHSEGTDDALLEQANGHLQTALAIRPNDSAVHYQIGEFHIAKYRQLTVLELIREAANVDLEQNTPPSSTTDADLSDAEIIQQQDVLRKQIWSGSSLLSLNRLAQVSRKSVPLNEIVGPSRLRHLEEAWEGYREAENLSPMLPDTQFRLAELSVLMEKNPNQDAHVEEALARRPDSYRAFYRSGRLYLNSGQVDKASQMWQKSLAISRRFEKPIVEFGRTELPMRLLFEQVLPQQPETLIRIAKRYFSEPNQYLARRLLLMHTDRVVQSSDSSLAEREFLSGQVDDLSQDYLAASDHYRKAVELNSKDFDWRFSLAKCLYNLHDFDGALFHLKVCKLLPSTKSPTIARWIKRIERERSRSAQVIKSNSILTH